MKTNVKLIEDHNRSSWDVTMENLKKLDLTLEDIAGLFYGNQHEYKRIADDLTDATRIHDDMVIHICLARVFHDRLSTFPQEKFGFIVKLARDLPFYLEYFSRKDPKVSLDILKKNFELLYNKKSFWESKVTPLSLKFHLWEFAHTINYVYDKELYILNLDLIEEQFAINEATDNEFQKLKVDYFHSITKKQAENQKII
jgi:hypothetical protein